MMAASCCVFMSFGQCRDVDVIARLGLLGLVGENLCGFFAELADYADGYLLAGLMDLTGYFMAGSGCMATTLPSWHNRLGCRRDGRSYGQRWRRAGGRVRRARRGRRLRG